MHAKYFALKYTANISFADIIIPSWSTFNIETKLLYLFLI
jgi:hypothetical protein